MISKAIVSVCWDCHFIDLQNDPKKYIPNLKFEKINEDGIFKYTCSRGHTSYSVLQNTRFEILIEMAIENIIDEYYRESIFNFAAALERFFEFASEIIIVEGNVLKEKFDIAWKNLKNSSERQLGGFILLYLFRFNENLALLNSMTEIRNNIIHKEKIPDITAVKDYGNYVLNLICNIQEKIKNNISSDIVAQVEAGKVGEKYKKIRDKDPQAKIATISACSIAEQLINSRFKQEGIDHLLNKMKNERKLWKGLFNRSNY